MNEMLSDLESLILSCNSEQSKNYISESINSYKVGAYRAAIVSAWIAVVFDLIDKIRELAISGDGAATTIYNDYERYIGQIQNNDPNAFASAMQFERDILTLCKTQLNFFDVQQIEELQRLQADRNKCAHPSFQEPGLPYLPSAEMARLHIRNAVVYVLSKPPVQGRAAMAKLDVLLGSAYYPTTTDGAISQLKSNGLDRPSPTLLDKFVDKLLYEFHDRSKHLYNSNKVLISLEAVHRMHPHGVAQRISREVNKLVIRVADNELYKIAFLAGTTRPYVGPYLNEASLEKLLMFIRNSDVLWAVAELSKEPRFVEAVKERISRLDVNNLATLVHNSVHIHSLAKARAIFFLKLATTNEHVNDIVSRVFVKIINTMEISDINDIYTYSYQNQDIKRAYGFVTLSYNIVAAGKMTYEQINEILVPNGFLPIAEIIPIGRPT